MLRTAAIPPADLLKVLEDCSFPEDAADSDWQRTYAEGLLALWQRPAIAAAIRTAAPDLADAVDRLDGATAKERQRVVMSLGRYLNRMSVRPTPLGLLAGISGGRFSDDWQVRLDAQAIGRARARLDMGWILHLHQSSASLEQPSADLLVKTNDLLHTGRSRVWLSSADAYGGNQAQAISVRAVAPVKAALARARTPVRLAEIRTGLLRDFPSAAPQQIDGLIGHLLRLAFLTTAERPALVTPGGSAPPTSLVPAAAARRFSEALHAMDALINEFNQAGHPHTAPALQADISGLSREIAPDYSGPLLQLDSGLDLAGPPSLPPQVAELAEQAADTLALLGQDATYPRTLHAYADAFVEHYGAHAEIPVLQVLSQETGLGPPAGYEHPARDFPLPLSQADDEDTGRRASVLGRLVATALRRRSVEVNLDDAWLRELTPDADPDTTPPLVPALDLCLQIEPPGDGRPRWRATLTGIGVTYGGRTFARFHDLLGQDTRTALEDLAKAEEGLLDDCAVVELTYLPADARIANVAIRPPLSDWELAVNVSPSLPDDQVIRLDDVLVSVRDRRLHLRSARLGRDVFITQHSMLNPHLAPNVCRFLLEVSTARLRGVGPFSWDSLEESMPFLPRLVRGDIVLRRARWLLRVSDTDGIPRSALRPGLFAQALRQWRSEWLVPRRVHLTHADHHILLDLESAASVAELRTRLERQEAVPARLEEAPAHLAEGFVRDASGRAYASEVVVPVLRGTPEETGRPEAAPLPRPRRVHRPDTERFKTLGSDWLFIKLSTETDAQDALLARDLTQLTGRVSARPFFLRYRDPAPHVRIRFHEPDPGRYRKALDEVVAWARKLAATGAITDFALATYHREIERYGGLELIDAAEEVFAHDSSACLRLLNHLQEEHGDLSRPALVALSLDQVARTLVPDLTARRDLAAVVGGVTAGGSEYRTWGRRMWDTLAADGPDARALARVGDAWASVGADFTARLDQVEADGALTSDRHGILLSLLHMHCNRMGLPHREEAAAYGMWRRHLDRTSHAEADSCR